MHNANCWLRFAAKLLGKSAILAAAFGAGCAAAGSDISSSMQPPVQSAQLGKVAKTPVTTGPALRAADMNWVNTTLASMTLDQKIGQMLMPGYSAGTAVSLINTYQVGGFIFQGNGNTATGLLNATNSLQAVSATPLIFSIDCEAGLGARTVDATRFPHNMGVAATRNTTLTREQGGVTARECRAVGIQIGFGPVLDVNTETTNPIIGVRSYSDKPWLVAELGGAYVQGANAEGLLCTYKHFPGHGASDGDSHNSMPQINIPVSEMQSGHVSPYSTLLSQGTVDLVMTAHVHYTQLDVPVLPATISPNALTGILRNQLNYDGVVISDSFAMAGLMLIVNTYDGVKIGVDAGLDIILTPQSMADAFNGLKDAVTSGDITMSRIDDSVRRILKLKSRAGMPESTTVSAAALPGVMLHPDNLAVANSLADQSICKARVQAADVPLTSTQSVRIVNLTPQDAFVFYNYGSESFTNTLRASLPTVLETTASTTISTAAQTTVVNSAATYDRIVVVDLQWKPVLPSAQVTLVSRLIAETGKPVIYCNFGSPYHIMNFPTLKNYYCGFTTHYETQAEMARVLLGQSTAEGEWPVGIAGVAETPVSVSHFVAE